MQITATQGPTRNPDRGALNGGHLSGAGASGPGTHEECPKVLTIVLLRSKSLDKLVCRHQLRRRYSRKTR